MSPNFGARGTDSPVRLLQRALFVIWFACRPRKLGLAGGEHKNCVSLIRLLEDVPDLSHEKCVRLLASLRPRGSL